MAKAPQYRTPAAARDHQGEAVARIGCCGWQYRHWRGDRLFREDPWLAVVGPGTVLDIEAREPGTKHATSLQQLERWLAGATANPSEASRKAKLKMMLMNG